MRSPSIQRILLAAGFAAFAAAACLPDRMAWNAAEDSLAYIRADGSVWGWSPGGTPAKELYRDPKGKGVFCFDPGLASGALFVGVERSERGPNNSAIRDLRIVQPDGGGRIIAQDFSAECGMTARADGRRAWFIKENKAGARWELWGIDPSAESPEPKRVFHRAKGFGYPCASADGRQILFTFDCETHYPIGVLDTDTATTRTLIKSAGKARLALYPVWTLGGGSVAYIETHPKANDPESGSDLGTLCVFDTATGETRRLGGGVSILRRAMLDKAGRVAYVTQAELTAGKPQPEMADIEPKLIQVVAFDLKTGERTALTREPEGAYWPVPDPAGGRVGYVTNPPGRRDAEPREQIAKLLDRKTGKTETLAP